MLSPLILIIFCSLLCLFVQNKHLQTVALQVEESLLQQRLVASQTEKDSLSADLARSDASNKALQADKAALQTEVQRLRAHRDRLVVQKKSLRVSSASIGPHVALHWWRPVLDFLVRQVYTRAHASLLVYACSVVPVLFVLPAL